MRGNETEKLPELVEDAIEFPIPMRGNEAAVLTRTHNPLWVPNPHEG